MKNFNTIAFLVLTVAIVVLYVMHFTCGRKCEVSAETQTLSVNADSVSGSANLATSSSIAYVNVDSLLLNYEYAKKLNETLLKKQEKSRNELTSAQQKLQAELEVFQQKYQAGGFLTKESFEKEQTRLYKKDQELQLLEQRLGQELLSEQQKMNKQLRDTVDNFFTIYNEDKRYKLILSNTDADNILYAEEPMNITNDVVEKLNQRYMPTKE